MSELKRIPNVGRRTEQALFEMGYTTIGSLKGKTGEQLYAEECALRGCTIDRCQLYLYRAVEYFVNSPAPDPQKCKWWYWKDEFVQPSPCGAVCAECELYPSQCAGCRKIKGEVYWLQYIGAEVCPVYDCCVNDKKHENCGSCEKLPCAKFTKDPTISDEQNEANLKIMTERLRRNK